MAFRERSKVFWNIIEYENKENMKKILQEKEELLIELFFQYQEIEKNFTEDDKFFRENLFESYKKKYDNLSIFYSFEKKFLMDTMNDIQIQLKKNLFNIATNMFKLEIIFSRLIIIIKKRIKFL